MDKKEVKKEKSSRSTVADIAFLIVAILVIVLIVNVFIAKINNQVFFFFNKYSMLWVKTNSMEDTIPADSFILVEKIDGEDVQVGDIITFYSEDPTIKGMLNTHKVIGINEDGTFITKGEHNQVKDEYGVPKENVVAKYVSNLSVLTFIGRSFMAGYGIIILGGIIVLFFIAYVVKSLKGKSSEEI